MSAKTYPTMGPASIVMPPTPKPTTHQNIFKLDNLCVGVELCVGIELVNSLAINHERMSVENE
jgi:hypothetical protein